MILLVLLLWAIVNGKSDHDSIDSKYYRNDHKIVFWMHIEKTSSWMGDLMAVWACPQFCLTVIQDIKDRSIIDPSVKNNQITNVSLNDWDGNNDYFNMFDNYLKNHRLAPSNNMMAASAIMNCSVSFDGYESGDGHALFVYFLPECP